MTSTSSSSTPSDRSESSSYCSQTQRELKNDVLYEIANHTWQFPPSELARMLSPKTPKHCPEVAGELLLLDQCDCMVDEPALQDTLNDVVTKLENDDILASRPFGVHNLTSFLTRCVQACHDVLDKQRDLPLRQDWWYNDSYQDQPEGRPADGFILPVETEGSWEETVSKAFDYARCSFSGTRMRSFILVLAFNQDEQALRPLIFHRGGLTTSEPYNITTPEGLKDTARLFLALVLWSSPEDAEFVPICTDTTYMLPVDQLGKDYALAALDFGSVVGGHSCLASIFYIIPSGRWGFPNAGALT